MSVNLDIVDFFSKLTEHFNDEGKCDECWFFGAPLTESGGNIQQVPEEAKCCVHVIVTRVSKNTVKAYNTTTTYLNSHFDDYGFTLMVAKHSNLGRNTYNEIDNHPIEEGHWKRTLQPLQECLSDTEVFNFCQLIGEDIRVTSWSMEVIKNYNDQNYTGWKIRGSFRKQVV